MKTKIQLLQQQVDAVKSIAVAVIEKSLQNTERLEDLQEKAERLAEQAKLFKKTSKQLKDTMFLKYNKALIKLIAFTLTMGLLAVVGLLGGLGLIKATTAVLLAVAIASLGMTVIAGTELACKLQENGWLKNPLRFFHRKRTEADKGHHVPRPTLDKN